MSKERALVLGGGGAAGNAWLIGVLAGLTEAGFDLAKADLIIGTSAGSTTAAQITSTSPSRLLADILDAVQPQAHPARPGGGHAAVTPMADPLQKLKEIIAASENLPDMRRRMGAAAIEADATTDASRQKQWHDTVASRLPGAGWPEQLMQITAVDARTGEPLLFDRNSGVDLVDAVAASCAGGGFAYRIGGIPYIDGGYRRSSENADLAAGYRRVLVLSPLGGKTLHPAEWGTRLAVQADELRTGGSQVEIILPDSQSQEAFGANMMDFTARQPAARAGHDQGQALAASIAEFWG